MHQFVDTMLYHVCHPFPKRTQPFPSEVETLLFVWESLPESAQDRNRHRKRCDFFAQTPPTPAKPRIDR